jgi:ABC-type Zn uptake system ZnuABC Zn-binding protein ZnuA
MAWILGRADITEGRVRVVASTTDLASIAEMIGGDAVTVESICRGPADPHYIQLLPSYMVQVEGADVYLKVGMELDYWADRIIEGSQNRRLLVVDCSRNITPIGVAGAQDSPSAADGHGKGNPHYWLDPGNAIPIAESITAALKQVDPDRSALYDASLKEFNARLDAKMRQWRTAADGLKGKEMVTYHSTWPYFARAFGIVVTGFVEPRPGIEPTPSHTTKLVTMVKERGIKVIGKEPFYSDRATQSIARETNARIVDLPTSVGSTGDAEDYFALFDALIARLSEAFAE